MNIFHQRSTYVTYVDIDTHIFRLRDHIIVGHEHVPFVSYKMYRIFKGDRPNLSPKRFPKSISGRIQILS